MMKKKALIVVSFGTTHLDAMESIENIENTIRRTFPEHDFFRVFTSKWIIRKLKQKNNMEIMDMEAALLYLQQNGYSEVYCQPTHMIPGMEYDKINKIVRKYQDNFDTFVMGTPLLEEEKYQQKTAEILLKMVLDERKDEAVVFMGHGSSHHANQIYRKMEMMFCSLGREKIYVGTVEGYLGFEDVEQRLKAKNIHKVHLMLMMIVAGNHAKHDLAGTENSWKSKFEEDGYEVFTHITGMGLLPGIPELYVEKLREKINEQK